MMRVYATEERPPGVVQFYSVNPDLARKPGFLLEIAGRYRGGEIAVVIDEVCADNTIYEGEPFVGPRQFQDV